MQLDGAEPGRAGLRTAAAPDVWYVIGLTAMRAEAHGHEAGRCLAGLLLSGQLPWF